MVATVSSSGLITAKSAGTAIITVKTNSGNRSASCTVTVMPATVIPSSVSINHTSLSMQAGNSTALVASVLPSNATDKTVTWSSSNTQVATVSSSGTVNAKAAGTTTITVKTNSGGKAATCTITVSGSHSGTSIEVTELTISLRGDQTIYLDTNKTLELAITSILPENATRDDLAFRSSNTDIAYFALSSDPVKSHTATKLSGGIVIKTGAREGTVKLEILSGSGSVLYDRNIVVEHMDEGGFTWPTASSYISSGFGYRTVNPSPHTAIDIAPANTGYYHIEDIVSVLTGVSAEGYIISSTGYGNNIKIDHSTTYNIDDKDLEMRTHYSHMSEPASQSFINSMAAGRPVSQGTFIGTMYRSGNNSGGIHLDFEIGLREDGKHYKFLNPAEIFSKVKEAFPNGPSVLSLSTTDTNSYYGIVDNEELVIWLGNDAWGVYGIACQDVVQLNSMGMTLELLETLRDLIENDIKYSEEFPVIDQLCYDYASVYSQDIEVINLSEDEVVISQGDQAVIVATVAPEDANNKRIAWSTSNQNVAIVDSSGTIHAISEGEAIITAQSINYDIASTCNVIVTSDYPVEGIMLDTHDITLLSKETYQLEATILPDNAYLKDIVWSSSNPNIMVDQLGFVSAADSYYGSATIFATTVDGGFVDSCNVIIDSNGAVYGVELNKREVSLYQGEEILLIASVLPEDAINRTLLWSSSDLNVTVNQEGIVSANSTFIGEAVISVTTEDGGFTDDCHVIVKKSPFPLEARNYSHTVATSPNNGLMAKEDGTVWAWGVNNYGHLGNGTMTGLAMTPVQVPNLEHVVGVAGSGSSHHALKDDGTVWSWGYNDYGQLGIGTTTHQSVPTQVSSLNSIVDIQGGSRYVLALKSDGAVWSWGTNSRGELGDGTTATRTSPVKTDLENVVAIAAGGSHNLALKSDGTVWAWGINSNGQLGNGTTTNATRPVQVSNLSGIVKIGAGTSHSYAIDASGTVWTWGVNSRYILGDGTATQRNVPVQMTMIEDVKDIYLGEYNTFVVKQDGSLWSWGSNHDGRLGLDNKVDQNAPVEVGLNGVVQMSARGYHPIAVLSDGTVWCWGYGKVGNGVNANGDVTLTPQLVFSIGTCHGTDEAADSAEEATHVTLNQEYLKKGWLGCEEDEDWYALVVAENGRYRVGLDSLQSGQQVTLLNGAMEILETDSADCVYMEAGETLYVGVAHGSGSFTAGKYVLQVLCVPEFAPTTQVIANVNDETKTNEQDILHEGYGTSDIEEEAEEDFIEGDNMEGEDTESENVTEKNMEEEDVETQKNEEKVLIEEDTTIGEIQDAA